MADIRNVFVSHIHEDDEGVARIKKVSERRGMTVRNGSITVGKFNSATNENYIKYQILAPRIRWASVLVVYVSPETKNSWWVDWEIEYAHKQGKRIVGVWEWGEKGCELPHALDLYADAMVGWNGESIVNSIDGTFNGRSRIDNDERSWFKSFWDKQDPVVILGAFAVGVVLAGMPPAYKAYKEKSAQLGGRRGAFHQYSGYWQARNRRANRGRLAHTNAFRPFWGWGGR